MTTGPTQFRPTGSFATGRIVVTTMIGAIMGMVFGSLVGVPDLGLTAGTGAGAVTGVITTARS